MPRRSRRPRLKLRLRKNTVYSIFAFGLILCGIFVLLSFTRSGPTLAFLNDFSVRLFGGMALFLPIVLVLFGLLFLRLKLFISRPHTAVGFSIFFISLSALFRSGTIGDLLYLNISSVVSPIGAFFIFIAGIFVGTIVFFDTSMDEILRIMGAVYETIGRLFPKSVLSFLKKKPDSFDAKKLTIKGEVGKPSLAKDASVAAPASEFFPGDKLVSNKMRSGLIWQYPPLSILEDSEGRKADRGDIKKTASIIEQTLDSFGIKANVVEVNLGPAVTQYAVQLTIGTRVAKITSLANDLALATEAPTGQIRIEAPIPGRNLVGIEIPNRSLEIVSLRRMLTSDTMMKSKSKLTISMGLDVSGNPIVADVSKMPHVLIAGTTGSGKSVMINSVIASLLFRASPEELKFILIDPKRVELTGYNGIPHLMTPVIVDTDKILSALRWAMKTMDERYKIFAEKGVRNIEAFNEMAGFQSLPYIVIIVDELADLMAYAPVEVEDAIARLAQMARATGIHLIVSTQRPSVDVITGLIKANIPARIAFNVSSMIDSRVILDTPGAEKLLGRGDMLYIPPDQAKPSRIQGAFVSDKEIKKLVDFLREKRPEVEYTSEITEMTSGRRGVGPGGIGPNISDPKFEQAVRIVIEYDKASASFLQRKLSIGYSKAASFIDAMEEAGVVGPADGAKPRDILVKNPDDALSILHGSTQRE
ncbi:MAG: cell division FtsK/SpoIIIE [Candidatus Levybacteria bacterium GW2011_GWA2_40_8]|nr:MAG: cell division FtsK/SpoIIIE [Candidatus Levybacteria bacterium GW2011_GWA2_40_8]